MTRNSGPNGETAENHLNTDSPTDCMSSNPGIGREQMCDVTRSTLTSIHSPLCWEVKTSHLHKMERKITDNPKLRIWIHWSVVGTTAFCPVLKPSSPPKSRTERKFRFPAWQTMARLPAAGYWARLADTHSAPSPPSVSWLCRGKSSASLREVRSATALGRARKFGRRPPLVSDNGWVPVPPWRHSEVPPPPPPPLPLPLVTGAQVITAAITGTRSAGNRRWFLPHGDVPAAAGRETGVDWLLTQSCWLGDDTSAHRIRGAAATVAGARGTPWSTAQDALPPDPRRPLAAPGAQPSSANSGRHTATAWLEPEMETGEYCYQNELS